ncbi:hypothetical protein ACFV6G_17235 [Streptomyces lavendulae]|uniref:hypothetical protein n=1 Tax=Streptomyces lavendulae TaxID=1914 RepID=UPI00368F8159
MNLDGEPDGLCTGFIRGPELTWAWINEPADAVTVGQPVVGAIIDVNRRRAQVQLSLKALQTNPSTIPLGSSAKVMRSRYGSSRSTWLANGSPCPPDPVGRRNAGLTSPVQDGDQRPVDGWPAVHRTLYAVSRA